MQECGEVMVAWQVTEKIMDLQYTLQMLDNQIDSPAWILEETKELSPHKTILIKI
jgi:hypothetical protein